MRGLAIGRAGGRDDPHLPQLPGDQLRARRARSPLRRRCSCASSSTGTGTSTPPSPLMVVVGRAARRGARAGHRAAAVPSAARGRSSSPRSAPRSSCCSSSSCSPTSRRYGAFPTAFTRSGSCSTTSIVRADHVVAVVVFPAPRRRAGLVPQPHPLRHGRAGGGRQLRRRPAVGHQREADVDDRLGARRRAGGGCHRAQRAARRGQRRQHGRARPGRPDPHPGGRGDRLDGVAADRPRRRRRPRRRSRRSSSTTTPPTPGSIDAVLLVIVLVAVLVVSMRNRGLGIRERFSFAPRVRPIPPRCSASGGSATTPGIAGGLALLAARRAAVPRHASSRHFLYARVHPDGAGRALAHGAHGLGRAALARASSRSWVSAA